MFRVHIHITCTLPDHPLGLEKKAIEDNNQSGDCDGGMFDIL